MSKDKEIVTRLIDIIEKEKKDLLIETCVDNYSLIQLADFCIHIERNYSHIKVNGVIVVYDDFQIQRFREFIENKLKKQEEKYKNEVIEKILNTNV